MLRRDCSNAKDSVSRAKRAAVQAAAEELAAVARNCGADPTIVARILEKVAQI